MVVTEPAPIPGDGPYLKKCAGCKRQFRSNGRNARFAPTELGICKCLQTRAKHRAKRARERRAYAKNPQLFRDRSNSRARARKLVLAHFGVDTKTLSPDTDFNPAIGCNSPGCPNQFSAFLDVELKARADTGQGPRGAKKAALRRLLKILEAHHRDHNCFNNTLDSYPEGSNIELLCRRHHEHADRAKAGKASLVLYKARQFPTFGAYLLHLRTTNPRQFFTVSVFTHWQTWYQN